MPCESNVFADMFCSKTGVALWTRDQINPIGAKEYWLWHVPVWGTSFGDKDKPRGNRHFVVRHNYELNLAWLFFGLVALET